MGRRARGKPADPQAILLRRAQERAAQRLKDRDPGQWGVAGELVDLPTSADVEVHQDTRQRVIAAKRSDPFDLLHTAGGLDDGQHRAARRLFKDWSIRAGVRDHDTMPSGVIDVEHGMPITEAMLCAADRVDAALADVGRVNARILRALIEPIVMQGLVIAWRGTVQRVTGETERHAQGAAVRLACEALRLFYGGGAEEQPEDGFRTIGMMRPLDAA